MCWSGEDHEPSNRIKGGDVGNREYKVYFFSIRRFLVITINNTINIGINSDKTYMKAQDFPLSEAMNRLITNHKGSGRILNCLTEKK